VTGRQLTEMFWERIADDVAELGHEVS